MASLPPGDPKYPGGPWFNMMSFGKTEEAMNDLKLKEVKNGRLAMISCLGFAIQVSERGVWVELSGIKWS